MMSLKTVSLLAVAVLAAPASLSAQTYAPAVVMSVTTPDGQTHEVTARESSVAPVTLKDGTTYELRPTIHGEPFSKVTVAIFKAATTTAPTSVVGEIELTKGAPAADSKTQPNFKIAVTRIDPPATKQSS